MGTRMGVADVGWVGGYAYPAFLSIVNITLVGRMGVADVGWVGGMHIPHFC